MHFKCLVRFCLKLGCHSYFIIFFLFFYFIELVESQNLQAKETTKFMEEFLAYLDQNQIPQLLKRQAKVSNQLFKKWFYMKIYFFFVLDLISIDKRISFFTYCHFLFFHASYLRLIFYPFLSVIFQ